jgi:hypothetical protein
MLYQQWWWTFSTFIVGIVGLFFIWSYQEFKIILIWFRNKSPCSHFFLHSFFVASFFLLDTIMLPWTGKSISRKFSLIFITLQGNFPQKITKLIGCA